MSDDNVARYQRPPRKGQFKPGQSGNPRGRPKGSRNIKTCVNKLLSEKIPVREDGKIRKIPRSEAIAIQLVNLASKGDPKSLAAILSMTRDFDEGTEASRPIALSRAEDSAVMAGIIARIRAANASPDSDSGPPSPGTNPDEDPRSRSASYANVESTLR